MTPLLRTPNARHAALPACTARGSTGLATLEWLLVIAAAGGFAAVMAVAFASLVDHAGSVDGHADAELVDAGIAAARISDDAISALIALENSSGDPDQTAVAQARLAALAQQCAALEPAYPDAISSAQWTWTTVPVEVPAPAQTSGRWVCRIGHRAP